MENLNSIFHIVAMSMCVCMSCLCVLFNVCCRRPVEFIFFHRRFGSHVLPKGLCIFRFPLRLLCLEEGTRATSGRLA